MVAVQVPPAAAAPEDSQVLADITKPLVGVNVVELAGNDAALNAWLLVTVITDLP